MKEPDTFDGSDPSKLRSFILLCNLHFRHNSAFSHDGEKITFALSHLRGTALELFEPTILDSSETPDWSHDWSAFVRTLRTHFGPLNPTSDAENDICNLKMSENHQIVRYNVKFSRLAAQTGWDNSALRHQYYSGLAERIKDIIAQQGKPSTLAAMKNLAHSIDSRHWERLREKFRSKNSTPHSAIGSVISDPPQSPKLISTPSENSDSEYGNPDRDFNDFNSGNSDSNYSDHEYSDPGNSDSENSNSEISDSGNHDYINSDSGNPDTSDSDYEPSTSESSDSDSDSSAPGNSSQENLDYENSEHESSHSEYNPGNSSSDSESDSDSE
jgi:hypothetical protein